MNFDLTDPKTKNALIAVFAGVFIIVTSLAFYKYNQTKPNITSGISRTTTDEVKQNENTDQVVSETGREDLSAGVSGQVEAANTQVWVANDYKSGEITSSNYNVKSGDTLWEIAEARYGDGSQWTKILEANKGSIGFLPNGSQALIFAGQTLTLP